MANYLLIHGSWHGAWCWYKIAPRLEAEGHSVTVPNLIGRGRDPARYFSVSLARMVKQLGEFLSSSRKTIVVVHSRYGVLASSLAEQFPEKIARTIYLASYMLPTGKRAAEYFRSDEDSVIAPYVEVSATGMWDRLGPEIYREGLYHDCNEQDNALGHMLLAKEPLRPALKKLKLTDDDYGRVPRAYIRLTEDRAVSIKLQDRLLERTSVDRVESIKASHSAYFSRPDELASRILKLSGS